MEKLRKIELNKKKHFKNKTWKNKKRKKKGKEKNITKLNKKERDVAITK